MRRVLDSFFFRFVIENRSVDLSGGLDSELFPRVHHLLFVDQVALGSFADKPQNSWAARRGFLCTASNDCSAGMDMGMVLSFQLQLV